MPERLWTLAEVATYLSVPEKTIYMWRTRGQGPRGMRVGRHVRFRREDVEEWLRGQFDPTSAA